MSDNLPASFRRPSWCQGAIFTGCDFFGLMRLLTRNRFRVHPGYIPDCAIDLLFGVGHTGLALLQQLILTRRVDRVELRDDPLFIIGHWRTGTTLLHELLALDDRHRCPTTFECFIPNHFLLTERFLKGWTGFTVPRQRPQDNMAMGWDRPQEDEFALCNLGVPSPYCTIAFPNRPPQFQEYFDLENLSRSQRRRWQRMYVSFLKQLVYKRPGRLVLKSPTHTFRLPLLCEMFPRARFVHVVRNPYTVFLSTVRLWQSLYASQGYQKPHYRGLEEYVYETFDRMHRRLESTRGILRPEQFHEIRYEDLIRDPADEIRTLYERLELGDSQNVPAAVEEYFQQRADYRPNHYELTAELQEEITRRWRPHIERQGYSTEFGCHAHACRGHV